MITSRDAFSSRSLLRKLVLVAAADSLLFLHLISFFSLFPHLKALIVLLPGNGIAESSVAHSYFTHQMQGQP